MTITWQSRDITLFTFLSLNLCLLDKLRSRRKDLVHLCENNELNIPNERFHIQTSFSSWVCKIHVENGPISLNVYNISTLRTIWHWSAGLSPPYSGIKPFLWFGLNETCILGDLLPDYWETIRNPLSTQVWDKISYLK